MYKKIGLKGHKVAWVCDIVKLHVYGIRISHWRLREMICNNELQSTRLQQCSNLINSVVIGGNKELILRHVYISYLYYFTFQFLIHDKVVIKINMATLTHLCKQALACKGPFINYVWVPRERGRGVGKISTYSYFGGRGSHPFLRNIFKVYILYCKSRGQVVWQGSYVIYLIIWW